MKSVNRNIIPFTSYVQHFPLTPPGKVGELKKDKGVVVLETREVNNAIKYVLRQHKQGKKA